MKHLFTCKSLVAFLFTLLCSATLMAADITGYRGDILYFTDNPAKVADAYKFYPGGVLYIESGKVIAVGDYAQLKDTYKSAKIVDYTGRLIIPGFIDTHIHYPQTGIIAAYGKQLLDWLKNYVYPAEEQFSDPKFAAKESDFFLDLLVKNGTTTALVFGTENPISINAFFEAALKRNMRMIAGKALMDTGGIPDDIADTPEQAYAECTELIKKWNDKYRFNYAVIPRFAPTSTREELAVAGKLLKEHPTVYMHTHLAENKQEVTLVKSLFPERSSYYDVYDHYGLVTNRSIFAHSIYLSEDNYADLGKKGAALSFCPTSNLFLGSGLFNLNKANKYNINVSLGTDVGAGTSFSMLQTMNEAYKVTQLRKAYADNPDDEPSLDAFQSLYLATLGGARSLSLDKFIGSFEPGHEADFIVLNPQTTPVLGNRINHSNTLKEKLFAIEMLGDDRTVEHTYVMGKMLK
ncbi:MAG: guanine deaminase [Mucilaginibacter sp.]